MNLFAFLVSLVLFIGGFVLMGYAFYAIGFQAPVFFSGIISSSLGVALPIHILKRIDG